MKKEGKIAVFYGNRQFRFENYPIPEVREDGILVKIEMAAICGSDGHGVNMTPDAPCTMGHEFVGRIVAMGERANETHYIFGGPLKVGDRIVPYPWITCGICPDCLENGNGICMICENGFCYGGRDTMGDSKITADVADWPHFKGGFSEYVYIFPGTYVWKVPEDMPNEVAVLLDPLAVSVRAIEMAQEQAGVLNDSLNTNTEALVIGAGAVGIMAAMVLKIMGSRKVVVTDLKSAKLELAKRISGADAVIGGEGMDTQERLERIAAEFSHNAPNLVLQCANTPYATLEGLRLVRKLGTYIEVGMPFGNGREMQVDLNNTVFGKNAKVMGLVANSPKVFARAFNLLTRHRDYPFDQLITHKFTHLEELTDVLGHMGDDDYIKGAWVPGEEE